MALRRFVRNRRALASAALLALIGLATLIVPWVSPHDYRDQDFDYTLGRPNGKYWMGTDTLGRDLFVRLFLGGRISFAVGLLATTLSVAVGLAYGSISAFAGGKTDHLMMRLVDILYGLPTMLIIIIVMAFMRSRDPVTVFVVIGLFGWLTLSRIVRGQVLSVKELAFVEAARALGVTAGPIIWRHMIPNILGPVIVYSTLSVPAAMLSESFLSFLGLGVSEPETSWGVLISEGANALGTEKNYWWLVTFPGAALALTLYCLNSIGDGLRDSFDVQQRQDR
jgi:oligopeptide transport system permease protein